jgi:CTP synthase (UTP-ammonia lyase)
LIRLRLGSLELGDEPFDGMHYCSYAPGPEEVKRLVESGIVVEAVADDASAEVLELPANRFFMLTLFQPHIGALAGKPPHPLLREFVRCARPARKRLGVPRG